MRGDVEFDVNRVSRERRIESIMTRLEMMEDLPNTDKALLAEYVETLEDDLRNVRETAAVQRADLDEVGAILVPRPCAECGAGKNDPCNEHCDCGCHLPLPRQVHAMMAGWRTTQGLYESEKSARISYEGRIAQLYDALRDCRESLGLMIDWYGGRHNSDCPQDDTCNCPGREFNDQVNAAFNLATRML